MTTALISRLEDKFQLLLKKMQFLQEENEQLQNTVSRQKNQLLEEQASVRELTHQVSLLKIATTAGTDGTGTRKELRSTINKYIREIDHCIAQLNE